MESGLGSLVVMVDFFATFFLVVVLVLDFLALVLVGLGVDIGIGVDVDVGVGVGVGIISSKSRQFVIGKQIDILYAGFFEWWWNYTVFRRTISWFLENYNV